MGEGGALITFSEKKNLDYTNYDCFKLLSNKRWPEINVRRGVIVGNYYSSARFRPCMVWFVSITP
jgi:hypothetical protein